MTITNIPDAKEGEEITKYIFKVDGCLTTSSLSTSFEYAKAYVERMWPRSTVEFVRSEFSHVVDSVLRHTPATISKPSKAIYSGSSRVAKVDNRSVEERMEQTIADTFSGVAA